MMLRGRGFRFEMTLDREAVRVASLAKHLQDVSPTVLTAIGVQAVSWAVQDFRARSGGAAAGGIQWKPITEAAARTRLAARAPWQNQSKQLEQLSAEQQPLMEKLRRKLPPGTNKSANRKAIANGFMESKDGQSLRKIQKKREGIRAKRKAAIAKEHAAAKVGVDTGRLVNSLVYGVQDLSSVRVGVPLKGEAPPRAAFDIAGNTIRIGSNLKYAGYFDAMRPIFGQGFLDAGRRESIDKLIEKTVDLAIKQKFGGGK